MSDRVSAAVDRFRDLLGQEGYRVTPQRLAIYEALIESPRHPSAEDLYERVSRKFPMISPATVYNTLQLLVKMGLATELGFSGETRYDGNPHVHVNVLCSHCKRIFDIEDELAAEIFRRVEAQSNFVLFGQRHEFFGICPECQDHSLLNGAVANGAVEVEEQAPGQRHGT
ncbi:MAG TPA: Fur family transcriptional regulator [Bacillota bacterium]